MLDDDDAKAARGLVTQEPGAAADPMSGTEPAAQTVRDIIEASRYLVLATADLAGRPWSSPLYFAPSNSSG